MCLAQILKEFRSKAGLSQGEMGRFGGVSQPSYARYEARQAPIPQDVVYRIAEQLNFPRLILEYNNENRIGLFNTPFLDKVDDHYFVVASRMEKELSEAVEAVKQIKELLINKTELSNEELEQLYTFEYQIADVVTCTNMHWVTLTKYFPQFRVKTLELRHARRLKTKKYTS